MSLYISEQIQFDENNTNDRKFGGNVITPMFSGSEMKLEASVIAPILSGSELKLEVSTTGSLELANPAGATLTLLFPNATTGSLYLVGAGGETWLAFKDISGSWRTVTASYAA